MFAGCDWQGSSPLARGLPWAVPILVLMARIIPARAGSTNALSLRRRFLRDHPRSRGVYMYYHKNNSWNEGSSPLARGLPRHHRRSRCCRRIIPARAGSTTITGVPVNVVRDHPRSRGVYMQMYEEAANAEGSSPLARGLLGGLSYGGWLVRIIPARAGSTMRAQMHTTRTSDHPRSRGVYSPRSPGSPASPGSSPLARGLLGHGAHVHTEGGIIPARAGSTGLI